MIACLVDLTGQFVLKLDEYYGDEKWVLYDTKTNEIVIAYIGRHLRDK